MIFEPGRLRLGLFLHSRHGNADGEICVEDGAEEHRKSFV
jgi:hypothetical protein